MEPVWDVLSAPRPEPLWVRLRRGLTVVAVVLLVLTGAVSVTGQILTWLAPDQPTHRAAAVSDRDFDAVAVPFATDYLSWDETDRAGRQTALVRSAVPDTTVDGWNGEGRQWADSATPIGIARTAGGDGAIVTVRLRVVPFTPADDPGANTSGATGNTTSGNTSNNNGNTSSNNNRGNGGGSDTTSSPSHGPGGAPSDAEDSTPGTPSSTVAGIPNAASGSMPGEGWVAGAPRWLNVAVPVARRGERVVVTAPPALVGSPQSSAQPPAVPRTSSGPAGVEDGAFARDTRTAITTLLRAYGSGDLTYARGEGTSFTGLNHAAAVEAVTQWRVPQSTDSAGDTADSTTANDGAGTGDGGGADGAVRSGDVTVTWALSGDVGTVTCTYRVELYRDGGRWYLASIGAVTEAVT